MTLSEIAELYHGRFDNFVSTLYYDDNDERVINLFKVAIENGKPLTNKKIDIVLHGKPLKFRKGTDIY
tara:strand:- start:186 stop:389 length:204 start_codon:yes stop_codon:yes gene_type:complete